MPLLFIITGYLSYDPLDIMQFSKKRMKRVLLPYIIPLLVIWAAIHFGNAKALLDILLGMLNSTSYYTVEQGVGPAWFYCAYVVSSIVFAVILHHCSCKRWALAISAILISAIGYTISRYIELPWQIDNAFVVVFFLMVGYLCKQYRKETYGRTDGHMVFSILTLLISLAAFQVIGIQSYASREYPFYPLCLILSCGTSIPLLIIFKRYFSFSKHLSFIGQHTVLLLGIHLIEYFTIMEWWDQYRICGNMVADSFIHGTVSMLLNVICLIILVQGNKIVNGFWKREQNNFV